jgi:DNA-binding NarL/FixJ family response regulator
MESPRAAIIMSVPTRVLIVDDNANFLRASKRLIDRDGISVAAVASTGEEAIRLARELHPDVVLVDIDLGGESGFDLARRLHDDPDVQTMTILISTHAEDDFADLVAESPALGFLSKSRLSTAAIRNMLKG